MAGGGDYTRRRIIYRDASTTVDFAATDGNTTLVTGKTNNTVYVQRIIVVIKTSAAQAITFQSGTTSLYVTKIPASPGADTRWDFDFGPEGKALPTAENLQMAMTAGNAGHVEVLAYFKPDAVVTVGNNN